jgi:hypothetical protein
MCDSLPLELKQYEIKVVIFETFTIDTEWTGISVGNLLKSTTLKNAKMFKTFGKIASEPIVLARPF